MDIVTFIYLAAAIITILGAATRRGRAIVKKIWHFFTRYHPKLPRKTLRPIQQDKFSWWSLGTSKGEPIMQIVSEWYITNISYGDVFVCKVSLRKPKTIGNIAVRHPSRDIYGDYLIPPGKTTEAQVDFWVQPPTRKENEPFVGTIDFIDQFGNSHRVRKVRFSPRPKKKDIKERPQMEAISEINDPVKKKVVSVLQAEVYRYEDCGRRAGGLGSIKLTYQNRSYSGFGTDWRKPDSPELQEVIPNPEDARIESDNASTLVNYYSTLEDQQKTVFIETLLERLSRDLPYASIGYLILFVLLQTGNLKDALDRAKNDLMGDSAYGFSDFLRLLDGLLKYDYIIFTEEMLNDIDKFIKGIMEHTFRIPERVAAIRALLILKSLENSTEE